ncbi:MAG: hypothetical protein WAN65_29225, partial [Candidatus Sulfotelmatobacter sp.]
MVFHYAPEWYTYGQSALKKALAANMIFYVIAAIAGLIGALGDSYLNYWAKGDGVGWSTYLV